MPLEEIPENEDSNDLFPSISTNEPFEDTTQTVVYELEGELEEDTYEAIEQLLGSDTILHIYRTPSLFDAGNLGIELETMGKLRAPENEEDKGLITTLADELFGGIATGNTEDETVSEDEDKFATIIIRPDIPFTDALSKVCAQAPTFDEEHLQPYRVKFLAASKNTRKVVFGTTAIKYIVADTPTDIDLEKYKDSAEIGAYIEQAFMAVPHFVEVIEISAALENLRNATDGNSTRAAEKKLRTTLSDHGVEDIEDANTLKISELANLKLSEYSDEFNVGYFEFGKRLYGCYMALASAERLNDIDEVMAHLYGYEPRLLTAGNQNTLPKLYEFLYGITLEEYLHTQDTQLIDEEDSIEDAELYTTYREPVNSPVFRDVPEGEYIWGKNPRVCYDFWVAKQIIDKVKEKIAKGDLSEEDETCIDLIMNKLSFVGLPEEIITL